MPYTWKTYDSYLRSALDSYSHIHIIVYDFIERAKKEWASNENAN